MFLRNGTYWTRVSDTFGAQRRISLQTRDAKVAAAVDAWLKDVKGRLDRHGILSAIIAGSITAPQAFQLGEAKAALWLHDASTEAQDVPITDEMLTAWGLDLVRHGVSAKTAADYRWQVEQVWPEPRMRSWLEDPKGISKALRALTCSPATKGRYRAALSSLVKWLMDPQQDILDRNPMPSVVSFPQATVRDVWYSREDARKVIMATPLPYRAASAIMYACGWEWAAVANAVAGDVDVDACTAMARGTKTATRSRLTVILDPWVLPILRNAKAGKLPNAPLFPNLRNDTTLKAHQAACEAVGVPVSTLHDWRHTFAVNSLKDGHSIEFTAQMLGHSTTTMVRTRYGRYALTDGEVKDVAKRVSQSVAQNREPVCHENAQVVGK